VNKTIWMCSGSCHGGRQPCTNPKACQVPPSEAVSALSWLLTGVIVLVAVAAAWHVIAGYAA
jgi:hypothetical protein